jgi:hypothetical protein
MSAVMQTNVRVAVATRVSGVMGMAIFTALPRESGSVARSEQSRTNG